MSEMNSEMAFVFCVRLIKVRTINFSDFEQVKVVNFRLTPQQDVSTVLDIFGIFKTDDRCSVEGECLTYFIFVVCK